MKKTVKIEGMMCKHCEEAVKKTLEEIEGVLDVYVSHEKNVAVITSAKELDNNIIKTVIENKDYKVISIED